MGMSHDQFKKSMEGVVPEPSFEKLLERFNFALQRTDGEVFSAMAAVNEVLATPITYEVWKERMRQDLR